MSIHTNKSLRVIVCEPQSFEEVELLTDHLKNRKQVIINFENTPKTSPVKYLTLLVELHMPWKVTASNWENMSLCLLPAM